MATQLTAEQEQAAQKEAAKKLYEQLQVIASTTVPDMQKQMEKYAEMMKQFEGLDIKAISTQVEKMKAGYEQIKDAIRRSSGVRVAGLEDESVSSKFSLVRAAIACKTKNWSKAGFEKEVMEAAKEAATKSGHVIGIDSQGGYFVPDQVIPDVIQAIYTRSVFIGLEGSGETRVSILDGLTGIPARIPKFDGGMIAYWIGEQDNYVESLTKTGNVSLTPKKLGVLTRLTDEMQRFQGYGFENMLRNDMQRAGAKLLDFTIAYGTGTENQPKGIIQYARSTEPAANQVKVFSAETQSSTYNNPVAGGVLDFDGLQNMQGALEDDNVEPNDSFAFISAPRYFRKLKQLKVSFYSTQTTNQAYLLGIPMMTDQRLGDFLGVDFDKSTQIPTANLAGASLGLTATDTSAAGKLFSDVFAGNFSEVVVGRWSGIEIVDDGGTGTGFINDQTYVKFRMYLDIGLRQPRALIVCADAKVR